MNGLAHRRRLFQEQNGKCHYCNVKMHMQAHQQGRKSSLTGCTLDHIIPKAEGGGNAKKNLIACCYLCNNIRGVIAYDPFRWFVGKYGRGVSPLDIFKHLDRKSSDYLDNLSTWGKLLHGGAKRIQREIVRREPEVFPFEPWVPKWKERRGYLTVARRNVKWVVDTIPYYKKNHIWWEYLKQEKQSADQHR